MTDKDYELLAQLVYRASKLKADIENLTIIRDRLLAHQGVNLSSGDGAMQRTATYRFDPEEKVRLSFVDLLNATLWDLRQEFGNLLAGVEKQGGEGHI